MELELHQSLHGYQNGHQLLAGSTEFSVGERKLLLFQSDLSGPNIDEGFEHYLTGYPIEETGRYAFAKTWYANEMKRPGCVWTHTLLINFSDLGRIPDFKFIEKLFVRPSVNKYSFYQNSFTIVVEDLIAQSSSLLEINESAKGILEGLYFQPEKITIVPASTSEQYQQSVLDIWSDQWPRLRRNFTFCTGALSIRTIDEKPYDLQIIPFRSLPGITRKSPNIFVSHDSSENAQALIEILRLASLNQRRSFLWTYGADVDGERKNYNPLLKIFKLIHERVSDLKTIIKVVGDYFPNKDEARLLKIKLLGKNSILLDRFTELNILGVVLQGNVDFVDLHELHIEERILKLLTDQVISLKMFLDLYREADQRDVFMQFFDNIEIEKKDLLECLKSYPELANILAKKAIVLAVDTEVWMLPIETQRAILNAVVNYGEIRPEIIFAMLDAKTSILPELHRYSGNELLILSLSWLNSDRNRSWSLPWQHEMAKFPGVIDSWIKDTEVVQSSVYRFVFHNFNFKQLRKLDLSARELVTIYNELKFSSQAQVFLTTVIFSLGLDSKLKHGEMVIEVTFADLYRYAATSQISKDYWAMVPKYVNHNDEEEQYNAFFPWLNFMLPLKKKNDQVANWDYCEILTRTIVNYYISQSWSKRSFLIAMDQPEAFKKAVEYCKTFNSGARFLYELLSEIASKNLSISTHQQKTIMSIN